MIMNIWIIQKRMLLFIPVVALVILTTGAAAQEEENVRVIVNAPEFVSGTFDVTIDIYNVVDLTSGNFDLYFDPDVVNALDVESGNIDGTEVPLGMCRVMDDKVIVTIKLPDAGLVSGSGYLATIGFEVAGNDGDTSALEVSDGELFSYIQYGSILHGYEGSTGDKEINVDWSGDVVTVGDAGTVETEKTASTPVQTATPRSSSSSSLDSGAGSVTASTPEAEHVSDAAVPVGTSERDEQDVWGVLAEHNFIEIYSFIGLLAFIYTLTLLK
jgi:hypothetical protein